MSANECFRRVGDLVTWAADGSRGEVVEIGYMGFKVRWEDGVKSFYLNDEDGIADRSVAQAADSAPAPAPTAGAEETAAGADAARGR